MHARLFQCAIAIALLIGAHDARAEQARDPVVQLRDWLWPRKVVPIPPPAPLPKEPPAELDAKPIEGVPEVVPPPVVVVPVPVQPARPKPKPKPRGDDDDDDRPARSRPTPQPANCKPITVDCNTVCSYARIFSQSTLESMRVTWGYCAPTASQRAQGKACIRKQCPEVLKP